MLEKKRTRPTYSAEFKAQAVAKCLEIGVAKTSEELGVCGATLRVWKSKESRSDLKPPGKPSYGDLEKENQRLKKELGYVNEINDILKKSTAIFSSKVLGGSL